MAQLCNQVIDFAVLFMVHIKTDDSTQSAMMSRTSGAWPHSCQGQAPTLIHVLPGHHHSIVQDAMHGGSLKVGQLGHLAPLFHYLIRSPGSTCWFMQWVQCIQQRWEWLHLRSHPPLEDNDNNKRSRYQINTKMGPPPCAEEPRVSATVHMALSNSHRLLPPLQPSVPCGSIDLDGAWHVGVVHATSAKCKCEHKHSTVILVAAGGKQSCPWTKLAIEYC